SRRKGFSATASSDLRPRLQDLAHREHDPLPLLGLPLELAATGGLEAVRLDAVAVLRLAPRADDGALLLQTMERREERARLDDEGAGRDLLDPLGDREPVARLERERPQDQEVERSLEQLGPTGRRRHAGVI